jgi:hypothetical protein
MVFAKTLCSRQISGDEKKINMKKLSIEELETTTGGRLRTCFIAGGLTVIGVGIGFGSGSFWGAGAALIAGLAAANYNGCL